MVNDYQCYRGPFLTYNCKYCIFLPVFGCWASPNAGQNFYFSLFGLKRLKKGRKWKQNLAKNKKSRFDVPQSVFLKKYQLNQKGLAEWLEWGLSNSNTECPEFESSLRAISKCNPF